MITVVNREQLAGTDATISCIVSRLPRELDEVKWTKSDNTDITSGQDGYIIDVGTFSGDSQTTTLTVIADQNTQDRTYNCVITSGEHDAKDESTAVTIKFFSESFSCIGVVLYVFP